MTPIYATLAQRLLDRLDAGRRALVGNLPIAQQLEALVEAGRARWPEVRPELGPLVEDLAGHLVGHDDPVAFLAQLGGDRGADLYFAAACGQADPTALRLFETRFFPEALAGLARFQLSAAAREEVAQLVRQKLFVGGDGRRPAILEFSGRGDLRGFLRVTTLRIAVSYLRRTHDDDPLEDEVLRTLPSADRDPELAHFKRRYTAEFKQALAAAIASVSAEERTLLRYYLVDKMGPDDDSGAP